LAVGCESGSLVEVGMHITQKFGSVAHCCF
jgi:hypothetical protein